ncbi:MAG: VWA domain-containing protein [Phycisphaeraceae bacterium]|nr:VWA domain-containing protein [Phycisphaeraceae bacterium]
MTTLSDFTIATPRPLPVIVLADISGSMSENGKIDSLNHALDEMIKSFATEAQDRAEIQVSVITFGKTGAQIHSELTPASKAAWSPMQADGGTPLGAAISLATSLVEDRQRIPGRAYRPAIVLVSDGQPTDEWKEPVKRLLASERGSRADRFALGIGDDADKAMLAAFLGDPAKVVLQASDARQVQTFFRWVTMSVTSRSRSATPNAAPIQPPISHATPSDGSCRLVRPRVRTIGASIAGPRHVREGRANQDTWASCRLPQGVVLVVSDGVGSCRYAEIGSRAACRAVEMRCNQ